MLNSTRVEGVKRRIDKIRSKGQLQRWRRKPKHLFWTDSNDKLSFKIYGDHMIEQYLWEDLMKEE